MNPFIMKKDNAGFLDFSKSFEKLIQALLDKNLPQVLKESVALGDEELQRSREAREYTANADALKAEIDALTKAAKETHDAATALSDRSEKQALDLAAQVASENARLDGLRKAADERDAAANARHIQQEARHTQQTNRENALNTREKTLESTHAQKHADLTAREVKLAKERAEHEEYQKNFRERAAAAQAALRG